MNTDPVYHRMRELHWRRKLTDAELTELRDWLAAHPEARAEWELETGLNQLLERLPEAPAVSSNFTAQVLQAVEREAAQSRRQSRGWSGWWRSLGWFPQTAAACLAVTFGMLTWHWHETNNRLAVAHNVAHFSEVVAASNPDVLENFEAIQRLGDPQPKPDTDLIALLK